MLERLKCIFGLNAFSPRFSFLFLWRKFIFIASHGDTRRDDARRLSGVLVSKKGKYDQKDQEDINGRSFLKYLFVELHKVRLDS